MSKTFKFEFTEEEIDVIGLGLSLVPYGQVANLVHKFNLTIQEQMQIETEEGNK